MKYLEKLPVVLFFTLGFLVTISQVTSTLFAQAPESSDVDKNRQEAERIWELAIIAKGGRENLYKVASILKHRSKQNGAASETALLVLPDKGWSYTRTDSKLFDEIVSMVNYENFTLYFGQKGMDKIPTVPMPPSVRSMKTYQNMAIIYLMESKSSKPVLLGVKVGSLGKEKIFSIHTEIDGRRVDFELNQDTYLPSKITTYDTFTDAVRMNKVLLSNYGVIDGVKIPHIIKYNNHGFERSSITFNVAYDPSIFVSAPVGLGSDAWKKGSGSEVN